MKEGMVIPKVTFKIREGDEKPSDKSMGGCPIGGVWKDVTTDDYFKGKRVVVFSLPGAFTPTCSSKQLPGFESQYEKIKSMNVDEVYCMSVNDSFVMNAWADVMEIQNVKVIPDGSGKFTRSMGMLVDMSAVGFGRRSRRFAVVINDGKVEKMFVEPEASADNTDPYGETSPENVLQYLEGK